MSINFNDLPDGFKKLWEGLERDGQRDLITCLGENMKQLDYHLRMSADVNKVGRTLLYIEKHDIPYQVKRRGRHVVFTFKGQDVRNQVLIGRNTI